MVYRIKKTVVIGLGGSGMHSVLQMKRKLLNSFGEIPPMIKFLALDTTDQDTIHVKDGEYKLDPGEFLKMEVRNPRTLLRTSNEIKSWLPDKVPMFALHAGAKQIRPLGRLAIFANSTPVEAKLNGAISSVRDFKMGRYQDKFELISDNIVVNIVCSIAGGTGSGCFLDIATMIRKNLSSVDRLIGYILLPDIFTSKPACTNVQPNAYAALRELNYFFTPGSKVIYDMGGEERRMEEGLFDVVFLTNNVNSNGDEYSNISDLEEFLGSGMFLLSSSTAGKGASDVIDNVEAASIGKKWYGKPTVFSSFGIGELVYPGEWYANLYAHEIALQVIQKVFMGGKVEGIKEGVEDFIDKIGIREDTADEVVNSILIPGEYPGFPLPKDFNRDTIDPTFERVKLHLNNAQREFIETAKENLNVLKERKIKEFEDHIQQRLKRPQQVQYCNAFIASFIGRIIEFKNLMIEEKETYQSKRENFDSTYHLIKEEAKQASKRLFGRNAAIEKVLKRFKGIVDQEVVFLLEIERREEAIEFFTYIIDVSRDWLEKLRTLSRYCIALNQELNQDIQKEKLDEKTIKPFIEVIKPKNLTEYIPQVEAEDFLVWLYEDKKLTTIQITEKKLLEVKNILIDYANSQEKVKEIKEKSIDEVLRELSSKKRIEYISLLDKIAFPLWQYNRGWVTGNFTTDNIYLFAVHNPEDTVFKPEEITSALRSPYKPSIIGTGDNKRILCIKVETAIPAFVLSKMPDYKKKYNISEEQRPFPYHINRNWENELPTLFPPEGEKESIKYFALGLVPIFELIKKVGEFYYVYSEKKGERANSYWLKLAQGRAKAMKIFIEDTDLVNEARENIDKKIQQEGNTKIIEGIKEYIEKVEEKLKSSISSVNKQITTELEELDKYIRVLSEE